MRRQKSSRNLNGDSPGMLCQHSLPAVLEQDAHSCAGLGLGWLSSSRTAVSSQRTCFAQRQHTAHKQGGLWPLLRLAGICHNQSVQLPWLKV